MAARAGAITFRDGDQRPGSSWTALEGLKAATGRTGPLLSGLTIVVSPDMGTDRLDETKNSLAVSSKVSVPY
jgi:hypothetical protein